MISRTNHVVLLALFVLFSLSGCDKDDDNRRKRSSTTQPTQPANPTTQGSHLDVVINGSNFSANTIIVDSDTEDIAITGVGSDQRSVQIAVAKTLPPGTYVLDTSESISIFYYTATSSGYLNSGSFTLSSINVNENTMSGTFNGSGVAFSGGGASITMTNASFSTD